MDLSRREQDTNNAGVDSSFHTSSLMPEAAASASVGTVSTSMLQGSHKTDRRGNGGVSAGSNGLWWSGKRSSVQPSPSGMAEAMFSLPHKPLSADSATTSFSLSITGFVPTGVISQHVVRKSLSTGQVYKYVKVCDELRRFILF